MFLEIAIVCAVVGAILLAVIPRRAKLNLPPGPRHYPLIGNLPQLAGKPGHVAMAESFHLKGHTIGFRPQIKTLEPPYKTPHSLWQ